MNDKKTQPPKPTAVQTTGHAWDGDLQEFNNPLPRWWLWAFYGTVVFAVIYWILYPSWPWGNSWLHGVKTVTFTAGGEQFTTDWNTRAVLLQELDQGHNALKQREFLAKITAATFPEIQQNPEMLAFARSVGKGLFGTSCAACHGRGGQGVAGLGPNLVDDDWLWGGTMEKIQETLTQGRNGFMPPFRETFNPQQLDEVAEYVLTLSGQAPKSEASERGRELFQGQGGGCYLCHGMDGKGRQSQGSKNLTDNLWNIATVPAQDTLEKKKEAVKPVIVNGVQNIRIMPSWKDRLSPSEIKVLAVYVHELGGGQ